MQITVFGASGKVGRLVTSLATQQGYTVVAFVHAHNPFIENDQLSIVEGDIHNLADVVRALNGSEAVISTLGSWGTKNKDILSSAMQTIIPGLQTSNTKRIVTLTGADALLGSEKPHLLQRMSRTGIKLVAPKILLDGEEHLRSLAASGLDWTTIRSPIMNNFGSSKYHLKLQWPLPIRTINRQAVAQALVDQVGRTDFMKQAPTIFRV